MCANNTGKLIKELRRDKQFSQQELADKLQVSNKTISRWETGEGYPDVNILYELSQVLGVSIHELLSGSIKKPDDDEKSDKLLFIKHCLLGHFFVVCLAFLIGFIFYRSFTSTLIGFAFSSISLIGVLIASNIDHISDNYDWDKFVYKIKRDAITLFVVYVSVIFLYNSFGFPLQSSGVRVLNYLPYGSIYGFMSYCIMYVYFAWIYKGGKYKELRNKNITTILIYGFLFYHLIVLRTHMTHIPLIDNLYKKTLPIIILYFIYTVYDLIKDQNIWRFSLIRFAYFGLLLIIMLLNDASLMVMIISFVIFVLFNLYFIVVLGYRIYRFKDDSMFRMGYQSVYLSIFFIIYSYNYDFYLILSFFGYLIIDVLIGHYKFIKTYLKDMYLELRKTQREVTE